MKKHLLIAVTLIPFFFLVACTDSMKPKETEKLTELKTHGEKFGYALGTYYGKTSNKNDSEMDINVFVQGFEDVMTSAKLRQTPEQGKNIPKEDSSTMPKGSERYDYTMGANLGKLIIQNDSELDIKAFVQGFKDSVTGAKLLQTPEEIKNILRENSLEMMEKSKIMAEKNKKEGEAFLAENAKKEGVITTESGLQYEILTEGTGPIPKKTDWVKVNYVGKLLNGMEFDSSFKRGRPSILGVTTIIPGLTEAFQMMKTGSKWRLFLPGDLAYKERGGANIGPNATLIFDIELLGIEEPPSQEKPKEAAAK